MELFLIEQYTFHYNGSDGCMAEDGVNVERRRMTVGGCFKSAVTRSAERKSANIGSVSEACEDSLPALSRPDTLGVDAVKTYSNLLPE